MVMNIMIIGLIALLWLLTLVGYGRDCYKDGLRAGTTTQTQFGHVTESIKDLKEQRQRLQLAYDVALQHFENWEEKQMIAQMKRILEEGKL